MGATDERHGMTYVDYHKEKNGSQCYKARLPFRIIEGLAESPHGDVPRQITNQSAGLSFPGHISGCSSESGYMKKRSMPLHLATCRPCSRFMQNGDGSLIKWAWLTCGSTSWFPCPSDHLRRNRQVLTVGSFGTRGYRKSSCAQWPAPRRAVRLGAEALSS